MKINMDVFSQLGKQWIQTNVLQDLRTMTKPGSLSYLMFGPQPSRQSISIKLGYFGEYLCKEIIQKNSDLTLLSCGLHLMDHKKKDIDLMWVNPTKQTVYVRELKGNIELDTEKLPAMFNKIKENLLPFVQQQYPGHTIDVGVLNWGVYSRDELIKGLRQISACEENGVKVDHWSDFCLLVDLNCTQEEYYNFMHQMGNLIKLHMDV
jgi:hypothetical protein